MFNTNSTTAAVSRITKLRAAMCDHQLDALLTTNTSDVRWISDFATVFDEEQAHMLLLCNALAKSESASDTKFGTYTRPFLFTDTRYSEAMRNLNQLDIFEIVDERQARLAFCIKKLALSFEMSGKQTIKLGIEAEMRLDWYRALVKATSDASLKIEIVELPSLATELRAIKDASEIAALKAAQNITDKAFLQMLDYLKPGLTEKQAAAQLEHFMRLDGADGVAFPSILAAGANSAIPHAKPSERVLKKGDIVLMDFGARLGDYCSDMTRTVVLGPASEQQRAMYAATLAAQRASIAALKPDVVASTIQDIANAEVAAGGFEGKMIHSVGHGVGIDIHELPVLASKSETALVPGHVVTIEPGVYLEGIGGIRIEDFGVITDSGFDNFTKSKHELIEIEC